MTYPSKILNIQNNNKNFLGYDIYKIYLFLTLFILTIIINVMFMSVHFITKITRSLNINHDVTQLLYIKWKYSLLDL